jgi:hypothetical protein
MSKYLYSVICTVAAAGIAMIAFPGGSRAGIKKHVGLICSLCVLCVIIAPFSEWVKNIGDFFENGGEIIFGQINKEDREELYDEYESIYNKYLEGGYGSNIGQAVKDSLLKKFGIPPDQIRVLTEFSDKDGDGIREPYRITVVLRGGSIFREPREIEGFVAALFECICVCAIE